MTTPTQHTADYVDLNPGDVLQNGDEFRWDGEWRTLEIHRYEAALTLLTPNQDAKV